MSSAKSSALNPAYPVLVLMTASVLWGLSWLPLKYFAGFGLEGIPVTLVGHGSVGVLGLGLLLQRRELWLRHWRGMLLLAAVGGLANLAFASAIVRGDVVRVMVLFYLLPVWGAFGGYLWLGERVDALRKLAVAGALGGAFLILGGPSILKQPPSLTDVLAVVSGMAFAVNNVWFRKLDELTITDKVAVMFVGCLLWALPLTLLGVQTLPTGVPVLVWAQLSGFGLVGLLLATIGTQWGVAHMEAGRSSVLIIMELLSAVLSAALINGTRLSGREWLGGALVVLAALAEARRAT
jgi:drug/metabolite transporter (DMT)-like permease